MINHPQFNFMQFVPSTTEHIECGSKHRIMVPAGKVGLAYDGGRAILLQAGRMVNVDSATFKYMGSRSINEEVIIHGSLTLVTVRGGKHGISFGTYAPPQATGRVFPIRLSLTFGLCVCLGLGRLPWRARVDFRM